MKIVLVNYRYFMAGGPERYMFNIIDLLEKEGHEVIPWSVTNGRNKETPWSKFFLSSIGSGSDVYFSDMKGKMGIKDKIKGLSRMVYSPEARKSFNKLLREVKPDLVYILYYQNKISCSVVDASHSLGIPVIQRISDYSLLAPCGHLYNMRDNKICEDCLSSGLLSAVKHKCVLDSKVYSAVKALAVKTQNVLKMPHKISRFVFPSTFTMSKFVEYGYNSDKLVHIPTLFNKQTLRDDLEIKYEPFALFIGRTDPDKGLMTLLDAFIDTPYSLKIIGFSSEAGYQEKLKDYIKDKNHNIEFLGRMDFNKMQEYLAKCLFTIVPSEWYDNLPNTILESYAMHKCVVATDIGSLSENIQDGVTGCLFEYKNISSLKDKITYLFEHPDKAREMGENAAQMVDTKYSIDNHVSLLQNLFEEVVNENKNKQK